MIILVVLIASLIFFDVAWEDILLLMNELVTCQVSIEVKTIYCEVANFFPPFRDCELLVYRDKSTQTLCIVYIYISEIYMLKKANWVNWF